MPLDTFNRLKYSLVFFAMAKITTTTAAASVMFLLVYCPRYCGYRSCFRSLFLFIWTSTFGCQVSSNWTYAGVVLKYISAEQAKRQVKIERTKKDVRSTRKKKIEINLLFIAYSSPKYRHKNEILGICFIFLVDSLRCMQKLFSSSSRQFWCFIRPTICSFSFVSPYSRFVVPLQLILLPSLWSFLLFAPLFPSIFPVYFAKI